MMRGYFGIGIYHSKTEMNVGTLWRSAYQLGAAFIFTIGRRYKRQSSDTCKAWRHIPLYHFDDYDTFARYSPKDCRIVAVEMDGAALSRYEHHERAIYLLGAEDSGLPAAIIDRCHDLVSIEAVRQESYNVAVAGSLVMYSRHLQYQVIGENNG